MRGLKERILSQKTRPQCTNRLNLTSLSSDAVRINPNSSHLNLIHTIPAQILRKSCSSILYKSRICVPSTVSQNLSLLSRFRIPYHFTSRCNGLYLISPIIGGQECKPRSSLLCKCLHSTEF